MVKFLPWKTLLIVCLLVTASCSPSTPTPVSVSTFTDPDPEFEEAVRQAQNTLPVFRKAFLAPRAEYDLMSLRVRFASRGETEDMWTEPMLILDDVYTVRMIEGVTLEQGIHPERLLDVKLQEIVDWMILQEDGTVIGGYTLRLAYERMTPEEQKKYLEITGYKFK